MSTNFKVGDLVCKVDGARFSNYELFATIERIDNVGLIWFTETDTYLQAKYLKLAVKPVKTLEQLQEEVFQLNLQIDKLKDKEAADERLRQSKRIDFSKIPLGTLVQVRDGLNQSSAPVRFEGMNNSNTYPYLADDEVWKNIKLVENPIVAWFKGGDCPIPDNVNFTAWFRSGKSFTAISINASTFSWAKGLTDDFSSIDIVAYQILESDWQD